MKQIEVFEPALCCATGVCGPEPDVTLVRFGEAVRRAETELGLARTGRRTLLVTTDPAAHTGQALGREVTDRPTAVPGEPHLFVARVDQEVAVREYRERILGEAKATFDHATLAAMEEELNSPCTEEMAAFERFLAFLTDREFEVVVFDTAPTGHTLRLLSLPFSWEKQTEMMVAMRPGTDMVLPESACTTPQLRLRREAQQHYLYAARRDFGVPRFDLTLRDRELAGKPDLLTAAEELWGDIS